MSDPIEREDAIEVVKKWFEVIKLNPDILIDSIVSIPSADRPNATAIESAYNEGLRKGIAEAFATYRLQGEWIGCRYEDSEWLSPMADFYKCSMCSKRVNLFQMRSYNFCPNCGSRMRKGGDDD